MLNANDWYLTSLVPQSSILQKQQILYLTLLITLFGIALISYGLAYSTIKSSLKRIFILNKEMKRVESGDLSHKIKPEGSEEVYLKSQPYDKVAFLTDNYISNCSLIRRSIADGIYYDEALNYKKLEDYDFLLNLIINQGAKPIYDEKTKLNYRVFDKESVSKRDSTRYHYEIYLQIIKKYMDKLPNEIYQALSENIFTLEGRLDNLIQHMDRVSDYIQELKGNWERDSELIYQYQDDIDELRNSLSYRVGNAIVTPIKQIGRAHV